MNVKGKKILMVGDSHTDWSSYGSNLQKFLEGAGATVVRLAVGGSWTPQWLSGKPVCRDATKDEVAGKTRDPSLIANGKKCVSLDTVKRRGPYDLAIIGFGNNDAANAAVSTAAMRGNEPPVFVQRIRTLAAEIGAPYFYIGSPSNSGKIKNYNNESLAPFMDSAKAAFDGGMFDSRPVTAPFQNDPELSDGVHFKGSAARTWAKAVFDFIEAGTPMRQGSPDKVPPVPSLYPATSNTPNVAAIAAVVGLAFVASKVLKRRKRRLAAT